MTLTEQTCRVLLRQTMSAPYGVAYTAHLAVDATTSNSRMPGVLARGIIFLNE